MATAALDGVIPGQRLDSSSEDLLWPSTSREIGAPARGPAAGGALDAVALAEATLAAIETCDDRAIAIRPTPDRALKEASCRPRRLRDGRARSLLDGVPIGWKDLFDLEGEVTTAGLRVLAADPPRRATRRWSPGQGGRHGLRRPPQHDRVRLLRHRPQPALRHAAQPAWPRHTAHPRRPSSSASGVARGQGALRRCGYAARIPAARCAFPLPITALSATRPRAAATLPDGVSLATQPDSSGRYAAPVEDAVLVDAAMRGCRCPSSRRRRAR